MRLSGKAILLLGVFLVTGCAAAPPYTDESARVDHDYDPPGVQVHYQSH